MLERVRHNLALKLLSIGLAVAAWGYLRLAPNPVISAARFVQQFNVPVTVLGLAADEVVSVAEKQVVVAVYVPRGATTIRADEVRAILHLESHAPGVYNVPVEVIAPKLEIKSLSPASVTLTIERVESRGFPLSLHYLGLPRRNIVVKHASVDPDYVTLRAPTSVLARVGTVRLDVPLPTIATTFDAMVRPIAADASATEVPNVVVAPNLLRVRVEFVSTQTPTPSPKK